MEFALLFNQNDQLLAATPASIHRIAPDCYWKEMYAQPVACDPSCQTAYVPITDSLLASQLYSLEQSSMELITCREKVSEIVSGEI